MLKIVHRDSGWGLNTRVECCIIKRMTQIRSCDTSAKSAKSTSVRMFLECLSAIKERKYIVFIHRVFSHYYIMEVTMELCLFQYG